MIENYPSLVSNILFQFHKGTIRTLDTIPQPEFDALFQFHKGTIRTTVLSLDCSADSNFNSIKVRL